MHSDERRGAHPPAGGPRLTALRGVAAAAVALLAALALAACGGGGDRAGETRTVASAFGGPTEVPARPRRVVALNGFAVLDAMVAMGMPPVAAAGDPGEDTPFGAWLRGRTDGVEVICCGTEPKLEEIVAQDPDLILANPWQADLADELSAIAPTVGVPLSYADYEREVPDIAAILGDPGAAEEAIAAHRERLRAFRAALGTGPGIVSVARVFPDGIRVEGAGYVPTLLRAAGLERPAGHVGEDLDLSVERLPEIDADMLLIYSADNAAEAAANARARKELARHPLWRGLRAVRAGRDQVVDSSLWAGGGLLWADAMLEDLGRVLAEDARRRGEDGAAAG